MAGEDLLAKVVIVGAGPMGLAAAYQAAVDGHEVTLLESAPEPGGMAAHFDFGGLSLERFYHFMCRADASTIQLLRDLGIADKVSWAPTTMGFFFRGKLHPWGDPISLLKLPGVSLLTKLRYGLLAFISVNRKSWRRLDRESAKTWLTRWCGRKGYDIFWRALLDYKFYEFADSISAEWIWNRVQRVGRSRKNIMQEELGFIQGGSQTLVDATAAAIRKLGGCIHLSARVRQITSRDGRVTGVLTGTQHYPADHVISTIPVQQIPQLVPDMPAEWKQRYGAIAYIGICCVIFKLRRSISPHFWVNINDPAHEIPGVIEFSNLRKLPDTIVYVPYYMPLANPKSSWTDDQLIDDAFACLRIVNPELTRGDLIDARVGRLRYAQPICDVGFAAKIPPVQTPIAGLQIADTCFYYPEDRGISESTRLGRSMARRIQNSGAMFSA